MPHSSEQQSAAVEQVESILAGLPPTALPASTFDASADDVPEFLRAVDQPVAYGAHC